MLCCLNWDFSVGVRMIWITGGRCVGLNGGMRDGSKWGACICVFIVLINAP